ncbi:MAG: hypothetical protein SFX74_01655 [Fimbriimonadaceae bacterium]|nr:hypothetical protein [Fimbriimonadaceae bacterium]
MIANYNGTGCRIVIMATTFDAALGNYNPGDDTFWGPGLGAWPVRYRPVATTFWRLVDRYTPTAVLTFTRSGPGQAWEFETAVRNNQNLGPNNRWALLDNGSSGSSGLPFIGGEPADPARAPGRPNAGLYPAYPFPPDLTYYVSTEERPDEGVLAINPESLSLQRAIKFALINAFPQGIVPAESQMGISPDNFVSAYVGYLAVWYQRSRPSTCRIAFHTHVCFGITLPICKEAFRLQLQLTIERLNS